VHEVYLKFSQSLSVNANCRRHFLAISANAMRYLIIDQLRTNGSLKRGANLCATTLSDSKLPIKDNAVEILYVHEAIEKLREIDEKLAVTVECKYFAGYSEQETAEALNVNIRTVRRSWNRSKKWLAIEFNDENYNKKIND
jgi:RNA polymerase sigma factor (TIGR02999 family)